MSETSQERSGDASSVSAGLSLSTAVMLALVAGLPALCLTGFSSFELLRKGVFASLGSMTLILWSLELMRRRRVQLAAPRVSIWLICLAVWIVIAIAWSPVPLLGVLDASYALALVAGALVALAPTDAGLGRGRIAVAAGLGTIIAGALGLIDAAGLSPLTVVWNAPGATGGWDAAEFGLVYYAVALPLLAGAQSLSLGKPARVITLAGLALGALHGGMMCAELSVLSSASLVAPLLLVALLTQRVRAARLKPVLIGVGVALALIAGGFPFAGVAPGTRGEKRVNDATDIPILDAQARPVTIDDKLDTNLRHATFIIGRIESPPLGEARGYIAQVAMSLVKERPLVGQGAAGWWLRQTRFPEAAHPWVKQMFFEYPALRSPHSAPLLIAVQYGLLGLVLALIWAVATTLVGASGLRAKLEDEQASGWVMAAGAWTGGLLVAPFYGLLDVAPASGLWLIASGLLLHELGIRAPRFGWRAPWTGEGGQVFLPSLLALVLGASMMVPPTLNIISDYWRGAGDQLMLRAYYDRAQDAYIKGYDMYPGHGDLAYNAALAAHRVGKLLNSRQLLNEALVLRPDDSRVLLLGAIAQVRSKEVGRAIELSRQAIAAWPINIEAYKGEAIAFNLGNDSEKAAESLLTALKLGPPDKTEGLLRVQLAELYEGQLAKPSLAIEQYELALKKLDAGMMMDRSKERLDELRRRVQRERLEREGKPVPPELMPKKHGEDDGHGH
jgi:hypothetical protein